MYNWLIWEKDIGTSQPLLLLGSLVADQVGDVLLYSLHPGAGGELCGDVWSLQRLFIFKVLWLLVQDALSNRADDFSFLFDSYGLSYNCI